jgi:cytochrome b subunit of formate dehydrogenase
MNTTQISLAASTAASDRLTHNGLLETQAWFYVTGIIVMLIAGTGVTLWNKMRIPWKRIIIENIIMVVLLGMYEIFFFKTIIYNYRSLTFEELNNNLVTQLQNTCGVLTY